MLGNGDTINFASNHPRHDHARPRQLPDISVILTITGPGATNLSIVNPNGRVFHITAGAMGQLVTIQGLRLSGRVTGAPGQDGQNVGAATAQTGAMRRVAPYLTNVRAP